MKAPAVTLEGLQRALAAGRVRDYLRRGRRFASAGEAEIREAWTAAEAAWREAPQGEAAAAAWLPAADAEAELLLRDLPLPRPLVAGAEGKGGDLVLIDAGALPPELAELLVDAARASRPQ